MQSIHPPIAIIGLAAAMGRRPSDCTFSETATSATTLSAGRVGGSGGHVLNSADSHASTGKSTEGGLGTGSRGLGSVTWMKGTIRKTGKEERAYCLRSHIPPVARILM